MLLRFTLSVRGFKYTDRIDATHIRLLRLPDSPSSSPLRITLETLPLDKCPAYLALSYTWGPSGPLSSSSSPTSPPSPNHLLISLNNHPFPILPNLSSALHHLSTTHPSSLLWIDSICIDQSSATERASQLSVMDRIYASASETLVWLGPATPRSARAVSVIRNVARGAEENVFRWTSTQTYDDAFVASDAASLIRNGLPPPTPEDWTDLADVYSRPWFGRVWMLQEVALSSNPTVLFGHLQLPWDALGRAALAIGLSNALVGLLTHSDGLGPNNSPLILGIVHATGLQILHEWARGEESSFSAVIEGANFSAGIDARHPSSHLLKLLLSTNGFRSTVRRDRVYSLLGVANHLAQMQGQERLGLRVDYASSDDEVLTEFGTGLFRDTQSLYLLSHAGLASRSMPSQIPTWLSSFKSVHAPIMGPNYTNLRPFNASAQPSSSSSPSSQPPPFTIDQPLGALHVKAATPNLGTVEELGETWPDLLAGHVTSCLKILLHCGDIYTYTNQPIVEAFWRTLIMDTDMSGRPAPPSLAVSFSAWFRCIAVTSIFSGHAAHPFLFDLFETLKPLWVLANSRDTTELLPTSSQMLLLLYQFGRCTSRPSPGSPTRNGPLC